MCLAGMTNVNMSSMLAIENNRENHPILNHKYDILAEIHNQGKQTTLCKVPAHIVIKINEGADKAAKQAINMSEMNTTRLPHTDYYLTKKRARNSEWQREWENNTNKLQYRTLNHASKNEKVPTTAVRNTSLN